MSCVGQSVDLVGVGAAGGGLWGAMWGTLVGLLFLNPLVGLVTGGALGAGDGALSGSLAGYGINDDFIRQIGETLPLGSSALFVLVRKAQPEKVLSELSRFRGRVIRSSLSPEQEARLQAVRESYPLIATWHDHEFSDDSWQNHATYLNDRDPDLEKDTERKRNAERAWLEYIPVDIDDTDTGANMLPPKIYRAFRFGNLLQIILTDYRTFRPNHLVDEGAFPGAIFATEPQLRGALGDDASGRLPRKSGRQGGGRAVRRARCRLPEPASAAVSVLEDRYRPAAAPLCDRKPQQGRALQRRRRAVRSDFDVFEVFVSTVRQRGEGNQDAYGTEQETFLRGALSPGPSGAGARWKVVALRLRPFHEDRAPIARDQPAQ
jgi:uncharacterized membrane protein